MLKVVYSHIENLQLDNFVVVNNFEQLINTLEENLVDFLSIPVDLDSFDIIDFMINNNRMVKVLHIQQHKDMVGRLKLFIEIAKIYSKSNVKKNVILKHNYIDKEIEKIKKD